MGKKFSKIRYDGSEEIFELKVSDGTGRQLARWKSMKRDFPEVIRILDKQFGFGIKIVDKRDEKIDRDLDWI